MRVALSVVVLVLALPFASAASVRGDLLVDEASLDGAWTLSAPVGALDLVDARGAWAIAFESARGWRVDREFVWIGGDSNARIAQPDQPDPENTTIAWSAGTLDKFTCGPTCRILLLADAPAALRATGSSAQGVASLAEPRLYSAVFRTEGAEDGFYHEVPAGTLDVRDLPAAEASGRLVLFFADAAATRTAGSRVVQESTLDREWQERGPAGIATGSREVLSFYVLELTGARLTGDAAGARLLAPRLDVTVEGAWAGPDASGHLVVDGTRHEVAGKAVAVDGRLEATLASGEGHLVQPLSERSRTQLSGEATQVRIDGAPVATARDGLAVEPVEAAAFTGAALLLAALAWFARDVLLSFLYTRLDRGTLLRNPNRERIYALVKAGAGLSLADLVRETKMTQVVVRHHLRILEQHRFIVLRGEGRTKLWFASDGAVDPARSAALLTLKDATRRAVAEALVGGALSQREIAERTGVSQRLVSYHLTRLEADGLVVGEGSMPRRYVLAGPARQVLPAMPTAATP